MRGVGALCAAPGLHGVKGASTHNARKLPKAAIFLRSGSLRSTLDAGRARSPKAPTPRIPRCLTKGVAMPILTLAAIRENPWHVVTYTLPSRPNRLLLELAHLAADYCRHSETQLMFAARQRRYIPDGWSPDNDSPDVHEESEALALTAEARCEEISELYRQLFKEELEADG